ncbi:MAG: RIP metalloprotease RseP [Deltaproteobacteria bacterium]|nr:RIP metalloprotease RseP [Deltaproteobacteria bacterium]
MSTSIVSLAIVLGVLIFVHEFGHFLVAKLLGVGVEKFSLGFGPRIVGKKIGMTDYRISALPLGGYVKMVGETPDSEIDPALIPLSFSHKTVFRRALIVLAGPAFNFFLAVLIFYGFFQISGLPIMKPEVGAVQQDMPAQAAGIQPGDTIVSVDGVRVDRWEEMAALITQRGSHPLVFEVSREGEILSLRITPKQVASQNLFGEPEDKYVIGITASGNYSIQRLSPIGCLAEGLRQTWKIAELTVVSVGKILTGKLSAKTIGGPIMIAQLAGENARAGMTSFIFFIALLSVNLGILNLLPIPVLDGGHLMFFVVEALTRRPVNLKMREVAQQIGMALLILLMVFVFYNDIARILFHSK